MFNQGNGYSLADIAAATGRDGDGFGAGSGAWWIIILFLFCFAGWGGNYGGFGGGSGVTDGYVLASDFSNIERKIDGVNNGLCDGFYTMNTGMLNGFSNIQMGGMQNTYEITNRLSDMAATNATCCCETQRQIERGFADLGYNLATQECQTRQVINDATRDIIDTNNANTRSILDFLTQDKIATLQAENQSLKFAASQAAQNAYLVDVLHPSPIPAYAVPNPYAAYYNNGCGCAYATA